MTPLRDTLERYCTDTHFQFASGDLFGRLESLNAHFSEPQARIIEAVLIERVMQDRLWGHKVDDTLNDPWKWTAYVVQHSTKWMQDPHKWTHNDTDEFIDRMIEVAAIAVAAAESAIRQRTVNGRTFYEPEA